MPDGIFIEMENQAYLINKGMVYLWSPFGYAAGKQIAPSTKVKVLTPRSIVNAIKAGYPIQMELLQIN